MLGKWDPWFVGAVEPRPFGLTPTYALGASWLAPCAEVEDWGCGLGWMRNYVTTTYRGVDGSSTPWADKVVDLVTYSTTVPGIFIRHVLEHNYEWRKILANAITSFTQRMALVLFTPLVEETREIAWNPSPGVPDLSFARADLGEFIDPHLVGEVTLQTASQYGEETIFYLEKR